MWLSRPYSTAIAVVLSLLLVGSNLSILRVICDVKSVSQSNWIISYQQQQQLQLLGSGIGNHSSNNEPSTSDPNAVVVLPPFTWNNSLVTDKCFYVEDICHSSQRWFYKIPVNPDQQKRQPKIVLTKDKKEHWSKMTAYQNKYRFERGDPIDTDQCVQSPITNHFVLYSDFNEMLGEFYDRGLVFLWHFSRQPGLEWIKHAQMYIHMYMKNRRVLDSHHLFTSPFRTLPLLDFTSLLDETPCTCIPRLIFCGYEVSGDPSKSVELVPGGELVSLKALKASTGHRDLRNFLRNALIDRNKHVRRDIQQYRSEILRQHRVPIIQHDDNWRIVGLAQRNLRRRWQNLDELLRYDGLGSWLFQNKIVLVEMNVEADHSSAYQQLVRHAVLDALIGIHGAQMTEAIWMKPGSWVVELLPHILPGETWGLWTTFTDRPTPLGWLFDKTDLNHVGYPLKRENTPYCYNDTSPTCWTTWKNSWDRRDFVVDRATLEMLLNATLVGSFQTCQDLLHKTGDTLVPYNVNCAKIGNSPKEPHHFYWKNATQQLSNRSGARTRVSQISLSRRRAKASSRRTG